MTVGGVAATVQYAGIVEPGEYQINLVVPQLADGDQPILATIAGASSQSGVFIPIQNSVSWNRLGDNHARGRHRPCGATLTFTAKVATPPTRR